MQKATFVILPHFFSPLFTFSIESLQYHITYITFQSSRNIPNTTIKLPVFQYFFYTSRFLSWNRYWRCIPIYKGIEKRKYERIEKPFKVSFRIIPLVAQRMVSTDWNTVTVKDFGAGGVHFNYDENLEIGALLDLKIGFPQITPAIHCIGKVIRVEESQPSSMFSIAIEFKEIDVQEKEMINNAVVEILS